MHITLASRCIAIAALTLSTCAAMARDITVATLADAVRVALAHSPALQPVDSRRQARRADHQQATLWPNPEASLEAENLAGSRTYRGAGALELTGRIGQRIELGGKREARIDAAAAGIDDAEAMYAVSRLDVARDAAAGLVEVVAAERTAATEREREALARQTLEAVRARIAAGREPPTALDRAEAARAAARIAALRATREHERARERLAVALAVPQVTVPEDPPWYAVPGGTALAAAGVSPDLAKAEAALSQARAKLRQEQAVGSPDVTVNGGIRYYRDTQDAALVVGLSLPIPVLNRNQGAIAAARAELVAAEADRLLVERATTTSIAQARRHLASALAEIEVFRAEAQPAAERAAQAARDGYTGGKLALLDLLDAQRALIEARDLLNKTLRDAHLRRVELARLAGALPGGD